MVSADAVNCGIIRANMPAESVARRAGAFLRSILPAEPAHWLMLVGSTLLYISADVHWWSGPIPHAVESYSWRLGANLITTLLVVAGAAGYYLSFVRRKRQSYYPFQFVFLPAAIVLITMATLGASWFGGPGGQISVIATATDTAYFLHLEVLKSFAMDFGLGFQCAFLGLVLVGVFFVMLRTGGATLPLRLSTGSARPPGGELHDHEQRRTMLFVWIMISLVRLAIFLIGLPIAAAFMLPTMAFSSSHLDYVGWADRLIGVFSLFLLILVVIGTDGRKVLRANIRLPQVQYIGISILIPATLAAVWPLACYVWDRIQWAASASGSYAPQPATYFEFPISSELWLLVPALVEEIAWRGFLQPRFVRRYGIARGIFLVGLVWGAFHFSGDFHSNMTAAVVVARVFRRLYMTVALSYVLAWLTIRSRSVLPAALAHGFYNIFLNLPVQTSPWLMPALWAACAWVLFRYFPVETPEPEVTAEHGPTLEPAI
jgi:membrane protease YdiL (CAAX protease family)